MNVLDYLILIVLLLAALVGYRKGFINSLVNLGGTIVIIVLAFYLKNPISIFLYEHFPFFTFSGNLKGITVYNIIIYEAFSFILTITILSFLARIIGKITGLTTSLIGDKAPTLFGRILGAIFGLIEGYIISFLICFIVTMFAANSSLYTKSNYCDDIVTKTPILNNIVKNTYQSIKEVYEITMNYQNMADKEEANKKSLEVLLKYEIISKESAQKLIENDKLKINNFNDILNNIKENLE